jgi:hypothetical protein
MVPGNYVRSARVMPARGQAIAGQNAVHYNAAPPPASPRRYILGVELRRDGVKAHC